MTNRHNNVNSLNIFLWNANGLKSHETELLHLFIDQNIDIGLITETHCTPTSKNFFPGYNVYRADHPDGTAHGGSAIIISSKIHCQPLPNLQTITMQAAKVQITLNHIPTTISSVYCPPRPAISVQEVEQFLNSVGNTSLIGGDFNSKHPQWGCRVENTRGRMFKNVLQNKRYTVISPPGPTYWPSHRNRHPDILDLFLSTIPRHIISTIKNLDYPACDHSPVFLQLNGKITLKPPRPTLAKGPVNWDLFSENLQNSTNLKISLKTNEQIEEAVQNLTTSIQTAVYNSSFKTNIPVENSILKNSLPLHIQELIKTKRRARARWQRYNLPSDKRILNNLTNTIKKLIQQHKSTFFQEKYESLNTKNGSLWKTTKNILQIKECSTPLNCPNGQLAISDSDKAETFGNHLSKTFTPHSNINPELEYLDEINNFLNSPLPMSLPAKHTTPNEVKYIINKLKIGKSPGYDLISNKILMLHPVCDMCIRWLTQWPT